MVAIGEAVVGVLVNAEGSFLVASVMIIDHYCCSWE